MKREKNFVQRQRESFFTSKILAEFLAKKTVASFVEEGGDLKKATFLEPSAGQGALVDALISEVQKITHESQEEIEKRTTIVELDKEDYLYLKNKYKHAEVINEDFILYDIGKMFDIIIANPPWSNYAITAGDFYEKYMPRLSGLCARNKEKIYTDFFVDNNLVDEFTFWKNAKERAYQSYKKLYPSAYSIDQCFLLKCKDLLTCNGISGFLMPSSIYNSCKNKDIRKMMYQSLRYLFRFHNKKKLFEDVGHHVQYTVTVFGSSNVERFTLIDNLYHPKTIEHCETERNEAPYPGAKNSEGAWDLRGHPQRIVTVDKALLEALAVFTGSANPWHSVLPTLHGQPEKELFIKLGKFPKMKSVEYSYHSGMHETAAPKKGLITRAPGRCPSNEMVLTGPNIFVGNPSAKEPNAGCKSNGDFTATNLCSIADDFLPQTVYRLTEAGKKSPEYLKKTPWGTVHNEQFRVAARFMLNTTGVRTLSSAIIAPKMTHINGIISLSLKNSKEILHIQSGFNSIILDFLLRNIGATNFYDATVQILPIIPLSCENNLLVQALAARTLRLNCISNHYAPLYQEIMASWKKGAKAIDLGNIYEKHMKASFISETIVNSPRPCGYRQLPDEWGMEVPLRKFEEREQALCETDALVAVLFGVKKETLLNLYRTQFAVFQKNYQDFPEQIPKKGKPHFPRYRVMEEAYDAFEAYRVKHNIPMLEEMLEIPKQKVKGAISYCESRRIFS